MKKIMLITLILLLFISCSAVYAEDNVTSEAIADDMDDMSFGADDVLMVSDNLEGDVNDSNLELGASGGEYVDASEAYYYLNAFRTEENVWYWNWDDTTQSHVNTNDTVWLKPLVRDVELENTAKVRAKEISEYFSHTRPDGTICFTAFPENLLDYGENIAYGYETCSDVTEGWKETNESYQGQGHRRTMLQADFNYVGIAGYKSDGVIYWVQNFGCRYDPQDIKSSSRFYFKNNTSGPEFSIDVPLYATGSFRVIINGNVIDEKSISNGKSSITVLGLAPGTYEVCLSYSGDYNCKPVSETKTIVVGACENVPSVFSFNELNTLIQMGGGEIKLEKDYAYNANTDSSFIEGILISRALTIDGQGHSIDGKNLARIFRISNHVVLKNIRLVNGNAMSIPDKRGYFDDSSYGPTSYYSAAAMANRDGGAIYAYVQFSAVNSTFANNRGYNGGAIFSQGDIYAENSSFTNNRANDDGGAMYSSNSVHITNTRLTDNWALDLGGAVYSPSTLEATNSFFKNNNNLGIFVGQFINNNNVIIEDEYQRVFSNASCEKGIVTLDKNYLATGTVLISGSNVIIDGKGYAIDAQNKSRAFYITGDNVTIKNIRIFNANSIGEGGAIYDASSRLTIIDSTFENSIAQEGGAVFGESTDILIEGSSFANNHLKDFAGSEITEGGAICTKTGLITIINSRFTDNSAFYGGAIHADSGLITIRDSYFKNNSALLYAGGVIHTGADVNISHSTFMENYAPDYGGAIFCGENSRLYIRDSTFTNNTSHHYGGAVSAALECKITDSAFSNNFATDHGGAIALWGNLLVDNSNFTGNTADVAGAIFDYFETGKVSIISSSFINNTQRTYGALDLTSNVIVRDSSFINNRVYDGVCGAITNYQNLTVLNSTFISNSAIRSWGVSVGGAITNYGENLHVEGSSFINNSADKGGAIANFAGNASVENSNFTENHAQNGGALYNSPDTNLRVSDSIFEDNAADCGGAISNDNYYAGEDGYGIGTVNVENALFKYNVALEGGAIYNCNSTAIISNSIFTDNKGSRGESINNYMGKISIMGSTLKNTNHVETALVGHITLKSTKIIENGIDVTGEYANGARKTKSTLELSSEDITLKWGTTATVNAIYTGATGITAKIGNKDVTVDGNVIVISDLDVGTYTLTVTTIPDAEHSEATKTAKITVKKADSTLTVNDVEISYGQTTKVAAAYEGATGITAKIDDKSATVNGNVISIPALSIGTHTLTVTTIPDANHNSTTKTSVVTVKKLKSTVALTNDVIFDYGSSGTTNVSFTNADGFSARVVGHTEATVKTNGNTIVISGLNVGTYVLEVTTIVDSNHDGAAAYANITVNPLFTSISADDVSTTYGTSKNIVVSLTDASGVLPGKKITVKLNNELYNETVNDKGQASIAVPNKLAVGEYVATITFAGDSKYAKSTASINVIVKKATVKLTAKAKTFKKSVKTKKYTVTLKTNKNKVMKNKKVTLKVNGKTYTAKTNAKGVATFKLTKLTKKGKFTATVKYAGSKYYNAKTVKPKITVK